MRDGADRRPARRRPSWPEPHDHNDQETRHDDQHFHFTRRARCSRRRRHWRAARPAPRSRKSDRPSASSCPTPPARASTRSRAPRSRRWPRRSAHPVVVDNQPGAGGIVGLQALARSAPDGITLCVVSNNVVIFPSVLQVAALRHAGRLHADRGGRLTPMVLVVNPTKVPAKNAKEFVALLKAKPGELNFGSGGNGTILHLAARDVPRRSGRQGASTSRTRASGRWSPT